MHEESRFASLMVLLFLTIFFLFIYSLLLIYYKRSWKSLPDFISHKKNISTFISVIVAARNEEKNIGTLLHALKMQSYPKSLFEVIVIDDFSTDATAEIIQKFPLQNLIIAQPGVDTASASKKKAIEAGIKLSKGELIITTDADCTPTPDWLQMIADFYLQTDASFIAAPVKFSHNKSLLQLFQSIDFLTLQGITAASVAASFHTMCNGANLAYKKQSFINVNGFAGIDKVATGDDMLLMHKIWKQEAAKVFYLKSKEAIVTTAPMTTWKDFFMQRKRWASKTLIYDDYRILTVLGFVYLLNCLFIVLLAASFFNSLYWLYVSLFLILKTSIELPFVIAVAKFYSEEKLIKYFFFFQPLHIFYTVLVGAFSQVGKYEWKGRRTK